MDHENHSTPLPHQVQATVSLASLDEIRRLLAEVLDGRLDALESRLEAFASRHHERSSLDDGRSDLPVLLTERDLGRLLNLHPRTIRRLECNHDLPPPLRISGSKRWQLSEIEQWIRALQERGRITP